MDFWCWSCFGVGCVAGWVAWYVLVGIALILGYTPGKKNKRG